LILFFVKSTETLDGDGNHTGSKITYEMLMQEAKKLGANDVINVKIDVNQVEEIVKNKDNFDISRTTYNYTASALAIKYTNATQGTNTGSLQNLEDNMRIVKTEQKAAAPTTNKKGKTLGIILGVVGGLLTVGLIAGAAAGM